MKGVKKCYGLLLALFITLGLSLSVCSGDSSALQYQIESFMVHPFAFPTLNSGQMIYQPSLTVKLDSDYSTLGLSPRNSSYLHTKLSGNKCVYNNSYINPGWSGSSTIDWSGYFVAPFDFGYEDFTLSGDLLCRTQSQYDSITPYYSVPAYDSLSTPTDKSIVVNNILPSNALYFTIPFDSILTEDGVDYPSTFDISDLFNNAHRRGDSEYIYALDHIINFNLPLNFNASLESLSVDEPISFSTTLHFENGISQSEFSSISSKIIVTYFTDYGSAGFDIPCYLNLNGNDIQVLCSGSVPASASSIIVGRYSFNFFFGNSNVSSSSITSINGGLSFDEFSVIFNNDSTLADVSGSVYDFGKYPQVAPGVARPDDQNADWFSSLVRMFSFSAINPFAPLFNMFQNNNSCVSIPTIASLLNSSETTYCPWFPSSIRDIVTPVLSMVSVMLIFGYFVRWLSSSSGNFFEDSKHEELTNQSASSYQKTSWYRRKK